MSDSERDAERQRQEQEAAQREHAAAADAAPPPPVEESPADALARKLATRGAQVVLEPDSDAAVAARGGMAADHQGNVEARDAALLAMGLIPTSPSGDIHDMTGQEKAAHVYAAAGADEPTPHLEAQKATVERSDAQAEDNRRAAAEGRGAAPGRPGGAL